MKLISAFYHKATEALNQGAGVSEILSLEVREGIGRFKYVDENNINAEYERLTDALNIQLSAISRKEEA